MRVQPWMTAVACVLLASGSLARAQAPVPESGYFGGPAYGPGAPAPGGGGVWGPGCEPGMPAGGYATAAGAVGAGGEVYAWPNISPYEDYPFSQHRIENGLWHWEGNNDPRRYYFNIDGLFAKYRKPETELVGDETAPRSTRLVFGFPAHNSDVVVHGFHEFRFIAPAEDQRGETEPVEGGLRLTWGFFEPDETGLMFSGWASGEAYWFFARGTDGDPNSFRTPRLAGGLPVNDGAGGVTIEYDTLYHVDFSSQGAGADAAVYMTPRWKTSFLRVQPLGGVRYLYIDEGFGFLGRDTGANYVMVFPPGQVLDPNTFTAGIPYEGRIESDVTSHLVGPEIGIRYMIGGENLRLIGDSRVGLAAAFEHLALEGNGIGDGFNPNFQQDSPFSRSDSHGYVSPTTAHSIDAQMNILGLIPLIKRLTILQEATLRVGYAVVWAGEVSRPYDTIDYLGQPLFPNIKSAERTPWYTYGWHVGMNFNY